jgi:hypothetical protein
VQSEDKEEGLGGGTQRESAGGGALLHLYHLVGCLLCEFAGYSDSSEMRNVTLAVTNESYCCLCGGDRGWDGCQDDDGTIADVEYGGMTMKVENGEEGKLISQGGHLLFTGRLLHHRVSSRSYPCAPTTMSSSRRGPDVWRESS